MKRAVYQKIGIAIALATGLIIAIGERLIFAFALARPLDIVDIDEANPIITSAALVSIPFFVLALRSTSRALSWATTFALTLLAHGWWLSKGITYQRAPDGSGVDMTGALIMLVSPLPITLIVVVIERFRQRAKGS